MTEPKFTKGPWRVSNGVNVMADASRYVAATAGLEDRLRSITDASEAYSVAADRLFGPYRRVS